MMRSFSLLLVCSLGMAALTNAFSPSSSTTMTTSSSSSSSRHALEPLHVSAMPMNTDASSSRHDDDESDHLHAETVQLPQGVHAPVTVINSPQELAAFMQQDDRLCVIKFHAAWCKSCQRFGLKFQGLANQKGDWIQDSDGSVQESGSMRFGSIEFGANTGMCRSLNIKRLPTVHFYQKGKQLEGFPCGPSKFPRLLAAVEHHLQKQSQEDAFTAALQEGEKLMTNGEVADVLQDMIEQEANGTLESKSTKNKGKKAWWNPLP